MVEDGRDGRRNESVTCVTNMSCLCLCGKGFVPESELVITLLRYTTRFLHPTAESTSVRSLKPKWCVFMLDLYVCILTECCCQARNEEKAQSMLYRFREAQAAELGLGTRSDRRPRMASACKSLRDCERWRGEILREISRKVSKIQDGASSSSQKLART